MHQRAVRIGELDGVRHYPVKSLRGESLHCAYVASDGIPRDRSSALFVRSGHARAGKTYRGKEHERLHLMDRSGEAQDAARARGVDLELRGGDRFFDDAPISLLVNRWLDDLSRHVGYTVEWERFRPNFFVVADLGFSQAETDLTGCELRLGTVRLRVRGPIERCVAITYHPHGEPSDPAILRYLAQERNTWMGVYCDVVEAGFACVGDPLDLL